MCWNQHNIAVKHLAVLVNAHRKQSTILLLFVALHRLTETLMALDMQTESDMVWLFLCH